MQRDVAAHAVSEDRGALDAPLGHEVANALRETPDVVCGFGGWSVAVALQLDSMYIVRVGKQCTERCDLRRRAKRAVYDQQS